MKDNEMFRFLAGGLKLSGGVASLLLVAALAGCASSAEPPQKVVSLDIVIEADVRVNADAQGRPAPIQVRVFELRSRSLFEDADFFSLQGKPRQVLGEDLAESDDLVLRPGDVKNIQRRADGKTVAVGIVAGYRDLGRSQWRATYVMPPRQAQGWFSSSNQTVRVRVKVGADTVSVTEAD